MSSVILFKYDGHSVKDIVALNEHLANTLGSSFQYVNYYPKSQKIVVGAVLGSFPSTEALEQTISANLDVYPDPEPPEVPPLDEVTTGTTLRMNNFAPYTENHVTSLGKLSMYHNRIIDVGVPIDPTDAANRAYVDSKMSISSGSGLSTFANETGLVLNVNIDSTLRFNENNALTVSPIQNQITSVGTLNGLNVTGAVRFTDTSDNTSTFIGNGIDVNNRSISNVPIPIDENDAANKAYVDSTIISAGQGTIKSENSLSANVDDISLEISEGNQIRLSSGALGTGLAGGSGTAVSVLADQSQITKVGILQGLSIDGSLNMNDHKITNVSDPINAADAANRSYVDSTATTAGNGLTKNGTIISVNTAQPQITSLGMLSALSVNGIITAYSGINANSARITSLGTPVASSDAATKGYVEEVKPTPGLGLMQGSGTSFLVNVDQSSIELNPDNAIRVSSGALGTGLEGGSGNPISVKTEQLQITSLGTLTSLSVDGSVSFYDTNDSTSATSGSIEFAGGIAVAKSAYIGGDFYALSDVTVTNNSTFIGTTVFADNVSLLQTTDSIDSTSGSIVSLGGISSSKSIFSGLGFRLPNQHRIHSPSSGFIRVDHNDSDNVNDVISFNNMVTTDPYITRFRLWNLGNENAQNGEYVELLASNDAARLRHVGKGNGIVRTLVLNESLSLDGNGKVLTLATTNSTSSTTGSFVVANGGGIGVTGNAHVQGIIVAHSGIDVNMQRIINVANPVNQYDAVNMLYVNSVAQGLSVKKGVIAASVSAVDMTEITDGYILDGVTLTQNDRILLKNQSNAIENGIYVVPSVGNYGAVRAPDLATGADAMGIFVFVESGDTNQGTGWVNTTPSASDIVDSDPLSFSQFSSAGEILAGYGLIKSGNTLSVLTDGNSLQMDSNNRLRVSLDWIGTGLSGGSASALSVNENLNHVTGVGTLTSGTWNANVISTSYGGTGQTSFAVGSILHGNDGEPVASTTDFTYLSGRLSVPNVIITATTASASHSTGALVVKGGIGTGGNLYVNGNASFTGAVTIRDPIAASDAATRGFVENNVSLAGTGLTKTSNILSVNSNLSHVTKLGNLLSMTTQGTVSITDTTDSNLVNNGSLITLGGIGVAKSITVGGNISVEGNASFSGIVTVGTPTELAHVSNKGYVDFLISTAGTGLTKTGNSFSVDSSLNHVTQVGTLNFLNVSGPLTILDTSSANSTTSGALRVSGGLGIGAEMYVSGSIVAYSGMTMTGMLNVTNSAQSNSILSGSIVTLGGIGISSNANIGGNVVIYSTSNSMSSSTGALVVHGGVGIFGNVNVLGALNVPEPTMNTHVATKNYVDANSITNGIGLTKIGRELSVNEQLNHVTKLGNLTELSVSGVSTFTSTSQSESVTTGSIVVAGGMGISGNVFTNGNIHSAGNVTVASLSVNGGIVADGSITFNGANLTVAGNTTLQGKVILVSTPNDPTDAVNKSYTDGLTYITVGNGLIKDINILSVDSTLSHVTSIGTLTGLTSSGIVRVTNSSGSNSSSTGALQVSGGTGILGSLNVAENLSIGGTASFSGEVSVPNPTNASNPATKSYTDGISYIVVGTGLTKTGSTLSVNSNQSQITSLGTLSGITSSGAVVVTSSNASTDVNTGALTVVGGIGVGGDLNIAGNVHIGGTTTHVGTVTVPTPTNATDAANKSYTDALTYLTAGTGLTKVGSTLSVNAAQTQITSIGTLDGLTSAGIVSITNTTLSTTTNNGALIVAGGIGVSGASVFGKVTLTSSPMSANDAVNKNYTDSLSYLIAGIGLTKSGATLSVNASQSQITEIGVLSGLTVNGAAIFSSTVSVPPPINPTDAVNKAYADALAQGLSLKEGVNVATTMPVMLSAVIPGYVIDGISLSINDRVLIKNQTNAVENGIYVVKSAGPAVRSPDMVHSVNAAGYFVFVTLGNINKDTGWVVGNSISEGVVGTHSINWVQFSSLGSLTAGNGLFKDGNTLSVVVDNSSLETFNGAIRISSNAFGNGLSGGSGTPIFVNASQPTITSVGTLTGLTVSGNTSLNNVSVSGTFTLSTTPVNATDAVNKSYTDGLSYLTAGTALNKTGNTISLVSSQITSLGTLTSLTSSGVVNITNSTNSTNTTSGAFQVVGGIGIGGSMFVGGITTIVNTTDSSSTTTGALQVRGGASVTKNLTVGAFLNVSNTGTFSVTGTGPTVPASFFSPSLTTNFTTIQIGVSGAKNQSGRVYFNYSGTVGSASNTIALGLWGSPQGLTIDGNGTTVIPVTTDSISSITGALQVSGGAAIQKSLSIGLKNVSDTNAGFQFHAYARDNIQMFLDMYDNGSGNAHAAATSAFRIYKSSGNLSIGGGSGYTVNTVINPPLILSLRGSDGNVVVHSTNDSTSTSTGALQVSGGVGINKALWVGGGIAMPSVNNNAFVIGNTTFLGAANVTGGFLTQSVAGDTVLQTRTGTLWIGNVTNAAIGIDSSNVVKIITTADSTSVTSGALQVSGGASIRKSLYLGSTGFAPSIRLHDNISGSTTSMMYPPDGMIVPGDSIVSGKTYGNGTYSVLASSETGPTWTARYGFQQGPVIQTWSSSSMYNQTTGTYTGGVTTRDTVSDISYNGEIIDIKFPTAKYVTSVTIYPRIGYPGSAPVKFAIFGATLDSADDIRAVYLQTTTEISWTESTPQTFTLTTPGHYKFIRIVSIATKANADQAQYVQFTFTVMASSHRLTIDSGLDVASPSINGGYDGKVLNLYTRTEPTAYALSFDSKVIGGGITTWSMNMVNNSVQYPLITFDRGITQIRNTSNSTSITSGALQVAGGLGVGKNVNVGGNINIVADSNVAQFLITSNTAGPARAYLWNRGTFAWLYGQPSGTDNDFVWTLNNGLNYWNLMRLTTGGALEVVSANVKITSNSNQPIAISVNAPATATASSLILNSTNDSASAQWGIFHAGSAGTSNLPNGSLGFYNHALGTHQFQLRANGSVFCSVTTDATSTTSGTLQIAGGVGISKSLHVGTGLTVNGNASLLQLTNSSSATIHTSIFFRNVMNNKNAYVGLDGVGLRNWFQDALTLYAHTGTPIQLESDLYTAVYSPYIILPDRVRYGAPTPNTRSAGTKLVIYPSIGFETNMLDYALGIEGGSMWLSSPATDSFFRFYCGVTNGVGNQVAHISNQGLFVKGGVTITQSTSAAAVTLSTPTSVTPYTLKLPSATPATGTTMYLASDSSGNMSFPPLPVSAVYKATVLTANVKIYTVTVTTTGGKATCFPTTTGLSGGTALFTTEILFASATAQESTTSSIAVPLCNLDSISEDRKTVIFNVVTGTFVMYDSNSLIFAPNGTSVRITIIGV